MSEYAAPDYEPTADEIDAFLAETFADPPLPGQHGSMTMVPAFERYIWQFPVFWGHREVDSHGHISFTWCVPQRCRQEGE